jgi:PQQ-dependent dehydrogenase (methanol/ethanol family)
MITPLRPLCAALALALAGCAAPGTDWPLHGGNEQGWRLAAGTDIHRGNVAQLRPAWTWRSGLKGGWQATPIVVDGLMLVSLPFSHVVALDAATGVERWRYHHRRRPGRLCCGPANRGVAVADGRVFVGTVDARLVALDMTSGRVLWDVTVADAAGDGEAKASLAADDPLRRQSESGATGVGIAMAPQVVDGKVIVGITGVGYGLHTENAVVGMPGGHGRPGLLAAFDQASGARVWQFDVTGPGWEGPVRATTPDGLPLPRDLAAERQALPTHVDRWKSGGGSLWATPVIDQQRGWLFFGTGNPSPQMEDSTRPGDNLYTSSLVALDLRTGRPVWHWQQVPHDRWGYDVASPPVLLDLPQPGGGTRPVVAQASKLGWVYVHDRQDGTLLFKSEPFVPQKNLLAPPSAEGVVIEPGIAGGANWSPGAWLPGRGLLVVPAIRLPTRYVVREGRTADGRALRYVASEMLNADQGGTLTALDLFNGGRIRWQQRFAEPVIGGVLGTSNGLVFAGVSGQRLAAFDADSGALLWQHPLSAGVNAPSISYRAAGRQFIAVAAGGNALFGTTQGDELTAFALPN